MMRRCALHVVGVALSAACLLILTPMGLAGPMKACGHNYYGQLGDGTSTERWTMVNVLNVSDITMAAAGTDHSLALHVDGTAYAWGRNQFGQLGDGTTNHRYSPVSVLYLTQAVGVAAGGFHSLAVRSDGTVWSWGRNQYGQLGDGTTNDRSIPMAVPDFGGIVAVAAGGYHSMALAENGTVWAWGRNTNGQLGDGTNTDRYNPVQVQGLTSIVAIAAGYTHSLALRSDGRVLAWGENNAGQLGDGTNVDRYTPVLVLNLTDVVGIAAGEYFSLALKGDGTVWSWGHNNFGQLGDGTNDDRWTPVSVINLTSVVRIAAGENHGLAIRSDGTGWSWGHNTYGQLGDGTTTNRYSPVQIVDLSDASWAAGGRDHSLAVVRWRTSLSVPDRTGIITDTVTLQATLTRVSDSAPVDGRTITFAVDGTHVGSAITGATGTPGRADLSWVIPEGARTRTIGGAFAGDASYRPASAQGTLTCDPCSTELSVPDRSGTITEPVTLHAYLKRLSDQAWMDGKTVHFAVDGTWLGSAVTGGTGTPGRADYDWVIPDGSASRTIEALFEGDDNYMASNGYGTLACLTWTTRMATFDRTQRITGETELKCRLVRSDGVPVRNKVIEFLVEGTGVGAEPTDSAGYARCRYVVPDRNGQGEREILSLWRGDGGYRSVSKAATLTVLPALPYIWVQPRSVEPGELVTLYAYFRRLYDYKAQQGKPLTFTLDGAPIADTQTGTGAEAGIARYLFNTAGLDVGDHDVRCVFAGDPWVEAGYGQAVLNIKRARALVWVLSRTVTQGETARLYAYLRRLYDYMPQEGKRVTFSMDGTPIAEVTTGRGAEAGKARYSYDTSGLGPGDHVIGCKFEGDATLQPGYGQGTLTVLPPR